jgi:ABC-2 type transport system ATP-binding protein
MPPLVVVTHLQKRYGAVEAVRGVSFEIRRGEIFGLLGPNGAGKTTTLECLMALREPDSGEIHVDGIDVRKHPRAAREKIGVALQSTALQDKITPREALALFGSFYAKSTPPPALLERFTLVEKADAAFDTLSGGQRQRLALALAFVNQPELVLLDEPTAGLDPQARRELHGEIRRMKEAGHTVLLTTHYLEEAEALCDRIAIVDRGSVLATGTPAELIAKSSGLQSVAVVTTRPIDREMLSYLPGVENLTCEGNAVRFRTGAVKPALTALLALLEAQQAELVDLTVHKATLEDVFLGLTGSGERSSPP